LQGAWLAGDVGRAAYHAVFRGVPPLLLGELLFRLRFPAEPLTWLAFAVSVVLATTVSFALRFIVNLTAFWLLDYRGVLNVTGLAWTFLCGSVVPLAFLPDGPRAVVEALPFAAMVQTPIDVFLGKHQGPGLAGALAFQAFWALALLGLGRLLLAAGVRRLVVQGGWPPHAVGGLREPHSGLHPRPGPVPRLLRARLRGDVHRGAHGLRGDPGAVQPPAGARRLVAARGLAPVRGGRRQLRPHGHAGRPP